MSIIESKLKKILDCLPEMQYVVDRQGILKYLKFAKGYAGSFDPKEFIGKPVTSSLPEQVCELITGKVNEVFKSGCEKACRYSLELPEFSRPMHFEARLDLMDNEEVLISVKDITDQVIAETKLADSEAQYRHLFELNPLPMLILDVKSLKYLNVNNAAVKLYGYTREEFLGMSVRDIRPAEDVEEAVKRINNIRPDEDSVGIWRHRKKDGTVILVDIYSHLTTYEGREARIALINDVTKNVEAQHALADSEEKFRSVFESSPMGIHLFKLDEENRLIFVEANPAADKILDLDHYRYRGMILEEIFPEIVGSEVPKRYREAALKGTPWHTKQIEYADGNVLGSYEIVAFGTGRGTMAAMFHDISKRKKAEDALQESEEKFRAAFYTSPDAISISRLEDGALLEVNRGFLELTGFTRDEVVGKSVLELELCPALAKSPGYMEDININDKVKNFETQLKTKDKRIRETLVSTDVIQLEGRSQLLTVVRDVTEIKRAQRALEISEDKFRTVFMTSPDGVSISRLSNGVFVDVNESFVRYSGFTREEIIGKTSRELNMWADPEDRECIVSALQEKGYVESMEVRYRLKDGSYLDTLTAFRVMDLGGIPHIISIVRDYTQLKKAQNVLKESEERFRAAFDTSPDSIVIIDTETRRISHVNNGFVTTTGYSKEEVLGRTTEEIQVWEDPEAREQFYRIFGETGAVDGLECNFRYRDGRISKALISARPMEWAGQLHILVIVKDITGIVETRNRLQTSLAEKEILLKEVHHRVKNNLQVISGLLNLQALHMADEQGKLTYKESQNRVHTMALIHEELYQSEDLSQVDFKDYLSHLCNNVFSSYGVSMERIRCNLDIQVKELVVDTAIPCGLIVNELVSNSLKHAFPGERQGVINVSFKRTESEMFQLTVGDNGIGIPRDIDIHKSISLGLQLVSVLVEQLGGRLEVDNNEGTTFRMTLKEYMEAGTAMY